jgi:outer membrane protein insertion porin family
MIRRLPHLVLALLLLAASPARLQAADGSIVREIVVENVGEGRIDRSFVLANVGTKVGQELNAAKVAADVKRLLATKQFSTVTADAVTRVDGVRLVLEVKRKYRLLGKPTIEGNERYNDRRIRKWLALKEGDFVDDQVMGAKTRAVAAKYREEGFRDIGLSWQFDIADPVAGRSGVTLLVDEGAVARIGSIDVTGNDTVTMAELREAAHRPSPFNPIRWFVPKRYDELELAEIRSDVHGAYMDRGYLDAKVDIERRSGEEGEDVAVVTIQEGGIYHVRSVKLLGIDSFQPEGMLPYVTLEESDPASYGQIYRIARALEEHYGARGYLATQARPIVSPDRATHEVDLIYQVTEGPLVKIRNIIVRGNSRTRDKVVRRELLVFPGQTYNKTRIDRSAARLRNLGFFDQVRPIPEEVGDPAERDLIFELSEKRTGQFMMGAGFSSIDNLMGFVEVSQGNFDLFGWPNFTGGGQKLRLRAEAGSTRTDYLLSFTEPWFMNRRLSMGFDIYRRERDYDDYDERRTGGSLSLTKALPGANRLTLRYTLEDTMITDVSDTNTYYKLETYDFETDTGEPYAYSEEEDATKSALRAIWTRDTRNNPFTPTRGNRFTGFGELMGGPLGFDTSLYGLGGRTASYYPLWFGHVVSAKFRYEMVEGYGDTEEVELTDRLFLGGGRTLRGFSYREVGPKVVRPLEGGTYYARPRGGQSLFSCSLEYTVPVVKGIRFAGFYDIGNVWADPFELDVKDLARSAGVGVRFDMPGFPIRIDRAWIIEKDDPFTGEDDWVIWMGYDI